MSNPKARPGDEPEFPTLQQAGSVALSEGGLSIRDYFAARFAPVVWIDMQRQYDADRMSSMPDSEHEPPTFDEAARVAYKLADAMLEERGA